jgi:hypothetical protein
MQPEKGRHWVVRTQDHRFQRAGHAFQFLHIPWGLPKIQVDVDGRHGGAVQRRRHVSNQDSFETVFVESLGQ